MLARSFSPAARSLLLDGMALIPVPERRCACGCPLYTDGAECATCELDQELRAEACWAVVAFALKIGPVVVVAVRSVA